MSHDPLEVAVDAGLIRGRREGDVRAFLGIPYAAPPLGPLRWQPPQPVAPWVGARPATAFAPQCVQPPRAPDSVYADYAGVQPMSEDCLHLNVWTAASPDAREQRPVMVWFHGGAFQQGAGSNPVFVRGNLAQRGVVLVTFNYRLGPFGFLAHPALTAESGSSGHWGLLDMAAALGWVKRNIAAFGGDPDNVTIFGQSAGGAGVIDMLAAPATRGLFARAISQSFGLARMPMRDEAERIGAAFAERIGAAGLGAAALARLRALPADELLTRYLGQPERFMPVADGAFLERPVRATFARGLQQRLPLLTGWNADEGTTFVPPGPVDPAGFRHRLEVRFGSDLRAAEQFYPARNPLEARASSIALVGDELFAWGAWRAAVDQSKLAPTWVYHYDHPHPYAPGQRFREADRAEELGAFHSGEYPHVFGTTQVLERPWRDQDRRVTALMQAYWLRFAATGDPNATGLPAWPRFADARPTVLRIAPEPSVIAVPRREQLHLLDAH
jgi:para-nitrobenzyl esterase